MRVQQNKRGDRTMLQSNLIAQNVWTHWFLDFGTPVDSDMKVEESWNIMKICDFDGLTELQMRLKNFLEVVWTFYKYV